MTELRSKFVSRKISKVRWQPRSSSVFITGSYDDEENKVCVWSFPDVSYLDDDADISVISDDPCTIASYNIHGCVTDLKVISENLLLAATSLGSVLLLKYSDKILEKANVWSRAHCFQKDTASCTGISVKAHDVASVGEDGRLCIFDFNKTAKLHEIASPDQCSLTCVTHLRHQEILAGNSLGFLRLWDLRNSNKISSSLITLNTSGENRGISCIAAHPTQPHIVANGYDSGSLCLWDMRKDNKPLSLLQAHSAPMTELLFHPLLPHILYTASMEGSLWQWDSSALHRNTSFPSTPLDSVEAGKGNPWLITDTNTHKLDVKDLANQPWTCINTFDITASTLLWCTDNEELCILNNVAI